MADAPIRILSLFSGIGGLDLGVRLIIPAARTVCMVEWDSFCAAILLARMAEAALDPCPVWCGEIGSFDGRPWRGAVDLITASWPCSLVSVAGRRRAQQDSRWLWPVDEEGRLNPAFVEWLMGLPPGWTMVEGASRLDRLRALGNAVVPQQAALALCLLMTEEDN